MKTDLDVILMLICYLVSTESVVLKEQIGRESVVLKEQIQRKSVI